MYGKYCKSFFHKWLKEINKLMTDVLSSWRDAPWMTSFKHWGLRKRYLNTWARAVLLVSWPANNKPRMLSLISFSVMKLPFSYEVVSNTESKSCWAEALPASKSYIQDSRVKLENQKGNGLEMKQKLLCF